MKLGKICFILLVTFAFTAPILVESIEFDDMYRAMVMRYINEQQNYMTKPWLRPKQDDKKLDGLRKHMYQLSIKRSSPPETKETAFSDDKITYRIKGYNCYIDVANQLRCQNLG